MVANRDLLRAINRFSILNCIRSSKLISRVDIAKETGLSQASVTGITAELLKENLILEKSSGESNVGRRPILLSLNPQGAIVVGVKLFIYQISVVIINFEAEIIDAYVLPLERRDYTPQTMAEQTAKAVHTCLWQANFSREQISGLCISLPGWVDSRSGLIRYLPNYQWKNANLRDLVAEKLNLPTYVDNDANTMAVAEQWFGEGRGIDNFLVVTLEYGIGMGAVINGQLYRGQTGVASEFGHTVVNSSGPLCRCGKHGCIEATAGDNAILRDAENVICSGQWERDSDKKITIDEIIQAAKDGQPQLTEIYRQAGIVLGKGIANLVQLYNPAKIIITGRGVLAGDLLFKSMFETIPDNLSTNPESTTEIVIQKWTDMDWARGAGTVVLQEIYKSPAHQIVPTI
jgi:predicted NBD/HSP70 family sugar kinase